VAIPTSSVVRIADDPLAWGSPLGWERAKRFDQDLPWPLFKWSGELLLTSALRCQSCSRSDEHELRKLRDYQPCRGPVLYSLWQAAGYKCQHDSRDPAVLGSCDTR